MKVQDAIDQLTELHNPYEDIIIAWWTKEAFNSKYSDDWQFYCDYVDYNYDWYLAHDQMTDMMEEVSKAEDEVIYAK